MFVPAPLKTRTSATLSGFELLGLCSFSARASGTMGKHCPRVGGARRLRPTESNTTKREDDAQLARAQAMGRGAVAPSDGRVSRSR